MPTVDPQLKSKRRFCVKCGKDYTGHQTTCLDCSGPVVPLSDEGEAGPGRLLAGKYLLMEPLGEGGMGSVFRARQKNLDRMVAIKLLRLTGADRTGALRRFYAEAKHTSGLSHPHNVKVFDFGHTEDGLLFIVMELVEGTPLSAIDLPLAPAQALRIMEQVCSALAEAHDTGLIHRDLKPDNIMLSQVDGRDFVRVLDYGVAKSSRSTLITDEGTVVGTPLYMSPEQVSSVKLDARSDIYSLGALLYELVTGRPPFESPDFLTIVYKHKHEAPPPPRRFCSIPVALERLILSCLAKDRTKRPASVTVLRDHIVSVLDAVQALGVTSADRRNDGAASARRSLALSATEPARSTEPPGQPPARRLPVLALAGGALAVIGVILTVALSLWLADSDGVDHGAAASDRAVTSIDRPDETPTPPTPTADEPQAFADNAVQSPLTEDRTVATRAALDAVGGATALAQGSLENAAAVEPQPLVGIEPDEQPPPALQDENGPGPRRVRRHDRDDDGDHADPPPEPDVPDVASATTGSVDSAGTAADQLRSLTGDLLQGPPPLPEASPNRDPRVIERGAQ